MTVPPPTDKKFDWSDLPPIAVRRAHEALEVALDDPDKLIDHRWPSAVQRLQEAGLINWNRGAPYVTDYGREVARKWHLT